MNKSNDKKMWLNFPGIESRIEVNSLTIDKALIELTCNRITNELVRSAL